jgi:transposase
MDPVVVTLIGSACTLGGAVAGAMGAYWKVKPNGNGKSKTPVPVSPCPMHAGFSERLRLGEQDFAELKDGMREVQQSVARIEGMLAARA